MKRIVICFDGTGNDPNDAAQDRHEDGGVEDNGISNVLKLYFLLGGRIENLNQTSDIKGDPLLPSTFENQPCFYFQGVGTYGSPIRQLVNKTVAPTKFDVSRIIRMGRDALSRVYKPGDEIFLFGFSRGAALARRFAKVIYDDKDLGIPGVNEGSVRLLCAFDTVASFGKPNLKKEKRPKSEVLFENGNVVAPSVTEALHLVALDERRIPFKPTLMAAEDRVTEIWFPGVHSDIGGGYFYDGFSDITLDFVLSELKRRKLGLRTRTAKQVVKKEFADNKYGLDLRDIEIMPTHLGKLHWHSRRPFMPLTDRDIRICRSSEVPEGELVNVLPMIHSSAFNLIGDDDDYKPAAVDEGTVIRFVEDDGTVSPERALNFQDIRDQRDRELTPLKPKESKVVRVYATQKFCPTGLSVRKGEYYRFEPLDTYQWVDKDIRCGAFGWTAKERMGFLKRMVVNGFEPLQRLLEANWFELLACVTRQGKPFRVLDDAGNPEKSVKVNRSGELFAFPNDATGFYGNNRGFIEVKITRTK